jgi:hypothetical protein
LTYTPLVASPPLLKKSSIDHEFSKQDTKSARRITVQRTSASTDFIWPALAAKCN